MMEAYKSKIAFSGFFVYEKEKNIDLAKINLLSATGFYEVVQSSFDLFLILFLLILQYL